jgi:hypothetical protein
LGLFFFSWTTRPLVSSCSHSSRSGCAAALSQTESVVSVRRGSGAARGEAGRRQAAARTKPAPYTCLRYRYSRRSRTFRLLDMLPSLGEHVQPKSRPSTSIFSFLPIDGFEALKDSRPSNEPWRSCPDMDDELCAVLFRRVDFRRRRACLPHAPSWLDASSECFDR